MNMDETLVTDLLAACGLVPVGDPPRVTVDVLGRAVHAVFRGGDRQVAIEASVSTAAPPSAAVLEEASLHAPGDTWVTHHDDHVTARRTLVEPDAGQFFAALHELGKQVVSLAPHGPSVEPEPSSVTPTAPPAAAAPAPASTVPAGSGAEGDSWSFVDGPTPLRVAPNSEEVVAMLMPGVWYRILRQEPEWTWVEHPSGVQGVAERTVVNPA